MNVTEKNPPCPICSNGAKKGDTEFAFTNSKFAKPFSLYHCKRCQGYFQFPLPSEENITNYYQKEYYAGKANYSYIDERKNFDGASAVWNSRLRNIRKYRKNGNFLDVGCSFGGFVQCASRHFHAYGLDISAYAVQEGNKWATQNLKKNKTSFKGLYQGSLKYLPQAIRKQRFDVISLVEVIEHLENPQEEIQAAYELLNPHGMLVIQTANFSGWQAIKAKENYHYFLPGHLVYFTDYGMKKMLNNIGFSGYKVFYPVDFSLYAKLKKSRYSFKNIFQYFAGLKLRITI